MTATGSGTQLQDPLLQNPRRFSAVYSVYHHANPSLDVVRPLMPSFVQPMHLSDAVATLMENSDQSTQEARRLAAAALTRACQAHPHRSDFRHARDGLLGDRIEGFEEHHARGKAPVVAAHATLMDGECHLIEHHSDVHFDPDTLITRVRVIVKASRPVDATLAAAADPLSWATPKSDFFDDVYLAVDAGDSYEKVNDPHVFGSSWDGLFFERAQLASDGFAFSVFENILNVTFETNLQSSDPLARSVSMRFRLQECLRSRVGPLERGGGLDVDEGYYVANQLASDPDGVTTVNTEKSVRYTNPSSVGGISLPGPPGSWQYLNYTAPAVLGYWMDKLASEGVCRYLPSKAATSHTDGPAPAPPALATRPSSSRLEI